MTTDTERAAVIAKLQKLRKMTVSAGCTEHEAMAAMGMIARLMAEHNIQQDELSIRVDANGCVVDFFQEITDGFSSLSGLSQNVAKLFHCKPWFEEEWLDALGLGFTTRTISIKFFGYKLDVSAAIAMSEIIAVAVQTELVKFQDQYRQANPRPAGVRKLATWTSDYKLKAESFRSGMRDRLNQRLEQLIPAPVETTGRGLMVLKNQLVTDEWAKSNLTPKNLRSARQMGTADAGAYHAGRDAGSRVDLGTGRSVTNNQLRIGK